MSLLFNIYYLNQRTLTKVRVIPYNLLNKLEQIIHFYNFTKEPVIFL